MLYILMLD